MIRRPPRSTQSRSSAASDVYKRQVDMSSWESSACYPRRTFYPLSDGPSTWNHRITMTDFRLCSRCHSRSQAGFCHCTQQLISDQLEPTFARLRYSLGGDRPSQTTHHAGSRPWFHRARLEIKGNKGGISHCGSTEASAPASKPTTYSTHANTIASVKLQ